MNFPRLGTATVKLLGWTNVLMAMGLASILGWFVIASTACTGLTEPVTPLDRTDSVAFLAILDANDLKYADNYYTATRDKAGRITALNLFAKKIKVLPPEIGDLLYLVRIDLGNNEIASLPREMEKLINLEKLYLGGNLLDSIPGGMRFPALKEVYLGSNRLAALPGNFDVTAIEVMVLSGNLLTALPPDFKYLTRLTRLDLSNNRLESLVDFSDLGLKILDLSANRLKSLPPTLFNQSPTYFQVGSNQLCYHKETNPDSATLSMIAWLDERDRDWKDSQACP